MGTNIVHAALPRMVMPLLLCNRARSQTGLFHLTLTVCADTDITLTQLADDTTLFLRDESSSSQALDTLHNFSIISGL